MKTYMKRCLIGSIEFDPRRKYGSLRTSNRWKSFLDGVWRFVGAETSIPVDTSRDERYFIIYSSLRDFSLRMLFIVGCIIAYIGMMKVFSL